jgi:uncharacterized protein (DUF488 family)
MQHNGLSFDVFSLGFSNRDWEPSEAMFKAYRLEAIVDIRTVPRSRHTPQFNQEALSRALPEIGIDYVHVKELGGFRKPSAELSANAGWRNASFRGYADYMQTNGFEQGLHRLIALLRERRTAFACTEAVFWRCHRALVSDALLVRGLSVGHIFSETKCEPHRLTPFARLDGLRLTYPAEPNA